MKAWATMFKEGQEPVEQQFVLQATPSRVSIPPSQNGTMAKDGDEKIAPSEPYYEAVFVFRRAARLCVIRIRLLAA